MEHPNEMPEQRSASDTLRLDGPVIVRSDPFRDLRPFIEHLWKSRTSMCRNIYPDEFPRGTKEKRATKEEEDEFLLRYFSAYDLHVQGGRFLKQALYSIAKYNEDNVLGHATRWAEQYESFYADPSMDVAQIRNVLDEHEGAYFPDSFLSRVVLVISYGLKQFRDTQDKHRTVGSDNERASPPQAGLQQERAPVEPRHHEQAFFNAARQASFIPGHHASNFASTVQSHQQTYMVGAPQPEQIRYGPSLLHGQSRGTRTAPRQSHRQEHRGRHRRSSGSMHSPQPPMGPMVALQQINSTSAPAGFPDFDPSLSGFVDAPPGYPPVSYQTPLDVRFTPSNMHANADFYPPSSYVPAPKSRMPVQNGSHDHQSTPGLGYYTGDVAAQFLQHQSSGSFSQQGPRLGFSHPSNSPRVVDPNSFSRLPEERYYQRPSVLYGSRGGHRSSFNSGRIRRSSVRSGDGWQGQRDSRPFGGLQPRVQSDQRGHLAHAAERRQEPREDRSHSDLTGEHSYPLQRSRRQSQVYSNQASASVPNNDRDWGCGSDFVGHRRVDIVSLVATNLPTHFSEHALEAYITSEMNFGRVVVTSNNSHRTVAFVRFSNHFEAQHALGVKNLTFDGVSIFLRVPFKFWKQTDSKYLSPAQARQFVESGEYFRLRNRNYGSFSGGSHQSREPGRSERSTVGSEAAYQLQAPPFASTNESYDANLDDPVFEDSATSDGSDAASPSGGYNGPVLAPLSEVSTPQKHSMQNGSQKSPWNSPKKNRIITAAADSPEISHFVHDECLLGQGAGADDEQVKTGSPPQIDYESASNITSTGDTPLGGYLSVESATPSTQRTSSPAEDIAMAAEGQSLTEDFPAGSDSNRHRECSPKEDADDSFQTAVETPEASTRAFTPRSTLVEAEKLVIDEAQTTTPTPSVLNENAPHTARSPASITESEDTASVSTTGQSLISIMQASDKTPASKSGPKQTESLSPFARQSQAKKKDMKSKPVRSKNKSRADLEQSNQAKVDATADPELAQLKQKKVDARAEPESEDLEQAEVEMPIYPSLTESIIERAESNGLQSVKSKNTTQAELEQSIQATFDAPINADLSESRSEHGKDDEMRSVISKGKITTESEQPKRAKVDAASDADLAKTRTECDENNGPRKFKTKLDQGKHTEPTVLLPRDVVPKGDDKGNTESGAPQVLSTLSSMTALLTGALSSISTSKTKNDNDNLKASQPDGSETTLSASASTTNQDYAGSTATAQSGTAVSAPSKKPKKNKNKKKKKKPKNAALAQDEDMSSTETLGHDTTAGSSDPMKESAPHRPSAASVLHESTNILDHHLSSLGIKPGSVIQLDDTSIGYRASHAGTVGENLNLRATESEIERSRRMIQEMNEKEKLLKQRKG